MKITFSAIVGLAIDLQRPMPFDEEFANSDLSWGELQPSYGIPQQLLIMAAYAIAVKSYPG